MNMEWACPVCGGDGFVVDGGTEDVSRCKKCGGTGYIGPEN